MFNYMVYSLRYNYLPVTKYGKIKQTITKSESECSAPAPAAAPPDTMSLFYPLAHTTYISIQSTPHEFAATQKQSVQKFHRLLKTW